MTNQKITASVVLYNTPKSQIDSLLKSVLESSCVEKFFVIDNSPNDKWRILEKESEKIRYIHNENLGYGASCNLALLEAKELGAKYHVILNPDVRFEKNVLARIADFMDGNPDVSQVMPKVVHPDGGLQYLCKLLPSPSDLIFRRFVPAIGFLKKWKEKKDARYCLKDSGYEKIMNPPCLSGCFMFLRLETLFKNRIFFDTKFFMYFEDFDFVRRLHRVAKTVYFPEASVVHDHAQESYKSRRMLAAHIRSAIRYFGKYGWLFDRERREMNGRILREIGECAE